MMLKNKHYYFFTIAMIFSFTTRAQQSYKQFPAFLKANSVWAFGNYAGLDFNSGHPVAITDSFNDNPSSPGTPYAYNESGVSVADPVTGKLLFYFDGLTIHNREHHVMPNGRGISGEAHTTAQGSCVVPVIDSPGKYYLFTLLGASSGYIEASPDTGSLFYSVIDMSLDNGLGDVVPGRKNIVLNKDTLSEEMIAVPGDNCDVWLLVNTLYDVEFRAYHITKDGIDPNPVRSKAGIQRRDTTGGIWSNAMGIGKMAVSPDRTMLAVPTWNIFLAYSIPTWGYIPDGLIGVSLCKFDAATGIVSDAVQVEKNLTPYSVAFSPDNTKLYMINFDFSTYQRSLDQYDVSVYDSAAIANSKKSISSVPFFTAFGGSFKLYGDTIYLSVNPDQSALSTINKPNLSGTACDYQFGSIPLLAGTSSDYSLPNDVVLAMPPDTVYTVVDTVICSGWSDGINLVPSMISGDYTYHWNDHTTDTALNITDSGTYWVKYNNGCHYRVDSFLLHGSDLDPIITTNEFILGTNKFYDSYQWLLNDNAIPGATDSTYTATENGSYRVVVSDGTCTDTSEPYIVKNVSIDNIQSLAACIKIYPNPAHDFIYVNAPEKVNLELTGVEGKSIKHVFHTRKMSIDALPNGIYFLRITDSNGTVLKVEKFIKAE